LVTKLWLHSDVSSAVHAGHEAVKVWKRRSHGDRKIGNAVPMHALPLQNGSWCVICTILRLTVSVTNHWTDGETHDNSLPC